MGTRSVVARVDGDGFKGRYVHWDGYPTYRGAQLFAFYRANDGNLKEMLVKIIDEHPQGWSQLGDMDGFLNGAVCYCHDPEFSTRGDRNPMEQYWITDRDDTDCEWAYVFNEDKAIMFIYVREWAPYGEGAPFSGRWHFVARVDLSRVEGVPDWVKIEQYGNTLRHSGAEDA